jgi:uncharacterized membrane protein YgdD (TMEM256/DUF423 family)
MAVAMGAFGAHALAERLDPGDLAIFEVGARYQMYHALALLAVAWVMSRGESRTIRACAVCMVSGIILFSGSLYGLSLSGWRRLGMVTPIGGTLLIVGWLLLAVAARRTIRPRHAESTDGAVESMS